MYTQIYSKPRIMTGGFNVQNILQKINEANSDFDSGFQKISVKMNELLKDIEKKEGKQKLLIKSKEISDDIQKFIEKKNDNDNFIMALVQVESTYDLTTSADLQKFMDDVDSKVKAMKENIEIGKKIAKSKGAVP